MIDQPKYRVARNIHGFAEAIAIGDYLVLQLNPGAQRNEGNIEEIVKLLNLRLDEHPARPECPECIWCGPLGDRVEKKTEGRIRNEVLGELEEWTLHFDWTSCVSAETIREKIATMRSESP